MLHTKDSLIECVPNVSEGRRQDVIEEIAAAVQSVPGVCLLHQTSDADHNRSVFTFAGPEEAVCEAAYQLVAIAVARIDLRTHTGEHPRIGAADVIPFVPLCAGDMPVCVDVARKLGERLARELDYPVYLYEQAASAPHRRNLAEVRRGRFEGLSEKMQQPDWMPDFGIRPHISAGAAAVGAREPLVAFNMLLNTNDVTVANEIARRIRFSSGGLPEIKALGMYLATHDTAQVSVNLCNYRITSLQTVFLQAQEEAARMGFRIVKSELIGLAPLDALKEREAVLLPSETDKQVLEWVLSQKQDRR